jgi:TATA-box binding protein (TBP) (component of TFIID and TFIIIB)
MDEACGEGREFIVILKHAKIDEAIRLMLEKVSVERSFAGIYTKAKYMDKQVSIFRTGKIVIREFNGKKEAERFLEELLN